MPFSRHLDVLAVRVTFAPMPDGESHVLTVTGAHRSRTHLAVLAYTEAAFAFLPPAEPSSSQAIRSRILARGGLLRYGYQHFPYAAEAGDPFHEMPERAGAASTRRAALAATTSLAAATRRRRRRP